MPIHLLPPNEDPRGPDGRGRNRLRVDTMTLSSQCALKPKSYPSLKYESTNTMLARWGWFGTCHKNGDCKNCEMLQPTELDFGQEKALVRIDEENNPWIMNKPERGWGEYGKKVTWEFLARLRGWKIGETHKDEESSGFWLLKA